MTADLDHDCKLQVINAAVSSLQDEFCFRFSRHPEGSDLPDFLRMLRPNRESVRQILNERNRILPWPLSTQIAQYPTFWIDLHRNVQYEKLPRAMRPPRDVT